MRKHLADLACVVAGAVVLAGCPDHSQPGRASGSGGAGSGGAATAASGGRGGTGGGGRATTGSGGTAASGSGGRAGTGGTTASGSGGRTGTGGTTASGSGGPAGAGGTTASGSGGAASVPTAAFTFVAWGDTKDATAALSALSHQAAAFNPRLTIYSGDLVETFSVSAMNEWTAALDGTLSGASTGIAGRTFAVRGNHDDDASGFQSYMAAHDSPASVAARVGATSFKTMPGHDQLVYSFDVGNSHFVGLDVEGGDAYTMPADQIAWLDGDLGAAEARGLHHAFIFFHGPIYCETPDSGHCCTSTNSPAICDQDGVIASLLDVLDRHPIVTATFHGHEHVYDYVYLTGARIPGLVHPFRQFITGSAGAEPNACDTSRFDYCMSAVGFTTVQVDGSNVTVTWYRQGSTAPQHTLSFVK